MQDKYSFQLHVGTDSAKKEADIKNGWARLLLRKNGELTKNIMVKAKTTCEPCDKCNDSFGIALAEIKAIERSARKAKKYLISLTHKPEWKKPYIRFNYESEKKTVVVDPKGYSGIGHILLYNLSDDKKVKVTIEEL